MLQPHIWVPGPQCPGAGHIAEDTGDGATFPQLAGAVVAWSVKWPGTAVPGTEVPETEVLGRQLPIAALPLLKIKEVSSFDFGCRQQGPCSALSSAPGPRRARHCPAPVPSQCLR